MKKLVTGLFITCLFFTIRGQRINTSLQYVVKEPTKKESKVPVLIMLHGYGSNESDLFPISNSLDGRFMIFSVQAPNMLPQGGYCWYPLDFLPGQKFKYDYEAARKSREQIHSFISNACKTYQLDSTHVFLMGFSQGAMMAYDVALSAPKKIMGVICLSGRMLAETTTLKTDWTAVAGVKFFVGHGKSDNVINISDADKAVEFLKTKKVSSLLYNSYEMQHTISGKELNDLKGWLTKTVRPKQEGEAKK